MTKKYPRYLAPVIFILADYLAIVGAEKLALWCRNWNVVYNIPAQYIYLWVPLIFFVFLFRKTYQANIPSLLDGRCAVRICGQPLAPHRRHR